MRRPRPAARVRKAPAPRRKAARPAAAPRISVLLVDDHELFRDGIRELLSDDPSIVVVGEAEDGRKAVTQAVALDPDVILMDIGMPNLNGIEATRQIREAAPRSRVLMLTTHSDDPYIERVNALGAVGYILKQSSLETLTRAIRETGRGETSVDPKIRRRLLHSPPRHPLPAGVHARTVPRLSSREAEVLQMIAEGKANKESAAALGISIKTVEKHRQRLMSKLDIHDVAGLTRYAVTAGFVDVRVDGTGGA